MIKTEGDVISGTLERGKEKELGSKKICHTLTDKGNLSLVWDNKFLHSKVNLSILKKLPSLSSVAAK